MAQTVAPNAIQPVAVAQDVEALTPNANATTTSLAMSLVWSYVSSVWKSERFGHFRPVSEFLNTKRLGLPSGGVFALKSRVFSNVPYFSTNYAIVAAVFCVLTLLFNPLLSLFLTLPALAYWYLFVWKKEAPITLPVVGTNVGDRERWIAVAVVFVAVFLYAASELIWLVGLSLTFVGAHAVAYKSREEWETENLFEDVQL